MHIRDKLYDILNAIFWEKNINVSEAQWASRDI